MKLRYFCCIGAELKRQRIDFDYMNQIYIYVLSGTETLAEAITANFFNEVATSIQQSDIIFIYSADNSIYTPYKVVKDLDNNVSLTEVKPNFATELEQEMEDIVTSLADYLKKDGSIPLDIDYTPTDDQDIATKKYVDDNAGVGNLLSDGSVPMDLAYTPVNDQDIATKKYIDDEISGQGLGDLAFLDTVGSGQIDAEAITGQTSATIASGDSIVFSDVSVSGNLKKDTVAGILDVNKATANEYTKTQNFDATTLTDGATIAWDLSSNQVAKITLSGNRTLSAPTNMKDGATYILIVSQDATGSRTLAYNSVFKFPNGTAPTLSTTARAVDILTFVSNGTYMFGIAQKGFA